MSNFFKLVSNELIKTYIQKSTWVMYIILVGIIIGLAALTMSFEETGDKYDQDNWREMLQQENKDLQSEMKEEEFMEGMNTSLIAKNNYYLENDIQPEGYGALQFVMENQLLLSLVSLLTIIVAAGIVANEYRWGTIKLLLIRPISRTKILLSKYISVLLFAFITLLFVLLFSWVVGAIFFGVNGLNPHIVLEKSNGFAYVPVLGEIASGYGYKLINLFMMATFAFMISTIFKNSALAIGTAIFLMMAGNQIVLFFAEREWAKYILFANTDLSQYTNQNSPWIEGMTLGFSITMLLIYYVIFLLLSWVFFTKRDVAGN
ncbi:ABC transporter permease [Virgibacillus halodenitrificans]|uniref:ABC transporter permease n=1 Tax=Virgibacillus halodenitrificans TaxID=1482 RepID=A0ABR7VQJ9_VIRHA|nr:ABC transporter permease [Virgibacillus halodenitrificans]MBD1223128.1 ABC transporter permease [Virgibacillus halodenitrificans]